MKDFTIKTHSTFENVYVINAKSLDEAIAIVMDCDTAPDFYQKHLGEKVIDSKDEPITHKELNKQGYF